MPYFVAFFMLPRVAFSYSLIDCEQSLFGQSRLSSAGLTKRGTGERREEEGLSSLLNQTCSGNSAHQRRQPVKNKLICHLISNNRILYTNKTLYKMNLVPSPMCTFCGDHEETPEHLLVSCAYTKIFWLSVTSWLITYNMKIDKLDEVTILFGIFDNNIENCLLNHLIILGKYTIYLCRCKNIKPSLPLLKAKITETRKLEFSIAKKNKKESIHYKKWQKMLL